VQKARPGTVVNPKLVPAGGETKSAAASGATTPSEAPKAEQKGEQKPSGTTAEPKKHEAK
jgi:hypothetical protein